MFQGKKITAVIPIFNEGSHLKSVLDNVLRISIIDEIICVNDGSVDNTGDILLDYIHKCRIISYGQNRGKGFAVATGLVEASGDIVLLLDADILNYTEKQMIDMVKPLVNNDADYTVRAVGLNMGKKISGIRAYWRKDIIHLLSMLMNSSRYGIEPILNKELRGKKVVYVRFVGSKHLAKYQKYPAEKMIKEYWKEFLSLTEESFKLQTGRMQKDFERIPSDYYGLMNTLKKKIKRVEKTFIKSISG